MKCCVSTDVEIWTNWLTFEPDPDYSPDAGTALPSSISCKRSNMEFYYVGKISSIPIGHPSLTRGFTMVLFTASCRNTFVRGKCALPSALLVYNYCTHMNRWSTTYIQYSSITAHKWIDEAQRTFSIHQLLHTNESMKHDVHSVFINYCTQMNRWSTTYIQYSSIITQARSSAVADRPHDASCHWIFH